MRSRPCARCSTDRPDDVSVQLLAGRAYLNSAQLRRAEEAFTRVLELDPADHYARFALGKALQRQGRLPRRTPSTRWPRRWIPRPEYQEALGEVRARWWRALDDSRHEDRPVDPEPAARHPGVPASPPYVTGIASPADKQACPKEQGSQCWATS